MDSGRLNWPSEEERQLVEMVFCPDEEFRARFEAWTATRPLADWPEAAYFLLPRLYGRRHLLDLDPADQALMAGAVRKCWAQNKMLVNATAGILAALKDSRIPAMVIKGLPLAMFAYKDLAARPMYDVDVAVPLHQHKQAVEVLRRRGWTGRGEGMVAFGFFHAIPMVGPAGTELDLHGRAFRSAVDRDEDAGFFDRAIERAFAGHTFTTMDDHDALLSILVHGRGPDQHARCRWIVDAQMQIESMGDVDWDRLLDRAHGLGLDAPVTDVLAYLSRTFPAVFSTLPTPKTSSGTDQDSLRYRQLSSHVTLRMYYQLYRSYRGNDGKSALGFLRAFTAAYGDYHGLTTVPAWIKASAGVARRRLRRMVRGE